MLARWRHSGIKSAKAWPYQFENQPDKLKLEDELRNEVVSSSGDGLAIASLYSLKGVPCLIPILCQTVCNRQFSSL